MQSEYLVGTRTRQHGQEKAAKQRRSSYLDIPDHFALGADAEDDVTAPQTHQDRLMQQSFFSLLANAGTQADRHHFDADTSDGEAWSQKKTLGGRSLLLDLRAGKEPGIDPETEQTRAQSHEKARRAYDPLLKTVRPPPAVQEEDESLEMMMSSQILPQRKPKPMTGTSPLDVESRNDSGGMEPTTSKDGLVESGVTATDDNTRSLPQSRILPHITERLAEIFGLESREELVAEFPCWLLQNVLLQGYMYVLQKHICFYAILPPKTSHATKTGHLSKRSTRTPTYSRYWFVLKGDVLSYYSDASDLYFPSGSIDLRLVTSVKMAEVKDDSKDNTSFSIATESRVHRFKADSAINATEWVKQIQRVVFRSHHDGETVKIKILIDSIMDIEDSPVVGFAQNLKFRVLDNETFAVDEYFFSFLESGEEALQVLQIMADNTTAAQLSDAIQRSSASEQAPQTSSRSEKHNAPESEPVSSVPTSPNDEFRGPREAHADEAYSSPIIQHIHTDTTAQPSSTESEFSDTSNLLDDDPTQASQILEGSAVFREPTISQHYDNTKGKSGDNHKGVKLETTSSADAKVLGSGAELTSTSKTRRPSSENMKTSSSFSRLQDLLRAGSYPLQKASGIASILSTQSKRMGSRLANESFGYYEKVASMWAGKQIHYEMTQGDHSEDKDLQERFEKHSSRFRTHFSLPESERLNAAFYGWLLRVIPVYGKLYISNRNLCFRNLVPGQRAKMILPLKDIENMDPEKGFRLGYHGLVISIRGHEELFFEFKDAHSRDDCAITLFRTIDARKRLGDSGTLPVEEKRNMEAAEAEYKNLFQARKQGLGGTIKSGSVLSDDETSPVLFDDPTASIVSFSPDDSLNVTCLTIGSRGDVQPYIALCKALKTDGHRVTIATHPEFQEWIEYHGIRFASVAGDPKELMRICIDNDMFTPAFFRETWTKSRGWIDELLRSSWKACQGADLLIESPSAMAGIHIAEALKIPYFRAFSMSWTRTRTYPHAFAVPVEKRGGLYNLCTYTLIENVFWGAISGQINHWRTNVLGLGDTTLHKIQQDRVPFLYQLSPTIVPRPLDYSEWIHTTGYWFLDEGEQYDPPDDLARFIAKAKQDKKKLVYIGFGSITMPNPEGLTRVVVDSVLKADVRCILSKGWSDRRGPVKPSQEVPLPESIHQIRSVPHDWLFGQIDAAVHHGGAGTTGASLRAGIPTIIKPFFGDQFFYGSRVETLGIGVKITSMNTTRLSRALWIATHDTRMIDKARALGEQIRKENGVETAVQCIYRDLEYAKTWRTTPEHGREESTEALEDNWSVISSDGEESDAQKPSAGLDTSSEMGEIDWRPPQGIGKNTKTPWATKAAQAS